MRLGRKCLSCTIQVNQKYTNDWFTPNIPFWEKYLVGFINQPIQALEIGCFEGRATVWLLENILTHDNSRIITVDTFEGGEEHKDDGPAKVDMEAVLKRYLNNIKPYKKRVFTNICTSFAYLVGANKEQMMGGDEEPPFSIIYIDGSHRAEHVIEDAVLSWHLLKKGGVMIFDDYKWNQYPNQPERLPKTAIQSFTQCYQGQYKILHIDWQVILQKII